MGIFRANSGECWARCGRWRISSPRVRLRRGMNPPALPPELAKEVAQRLRDAVAAGDVTELADIAAALTAKTDRAAAYGEEIQRLTEEFDFDGLMELASRLDESATS